MVVEHFVRICVKCQNMKSIYIYINGLYRPLLIPIEPWENISMDFKPNYLNGTDAILMIFNQFSKLETMVPIKMIMTSFDSTKLFFDMWVRHDEMPEFIISDKDTKFMTSTNLSFVSKGGDKIVI